MELIDIHDFLSKKRKKYLLYKKQNNWVGRLWKPIFDDGVRATLTCNYNSNTFKNEWLLKINGQKLIGNAAQNVHAKLLSEQGNTELNIVENRSLTDFISIVCQIDDSSIWNFAEGKQRCQIVCGDSQDIIIEFLPTSFLIDLCVLVNDLNYSLIPEVVLKNLSVPAKKFFKNKEMVAQKKAEEAELKAKKAELKAKVEAHRLLLEQEDYFRKLSDLNRLIYQIKLKNYKSLITHEAEVISLNIKDEITLEQLISDPLKIREINDLNFICKELHIKSKMLDYCLGLPNLPIAKMYFEYKEKHKKDGANISCFGCLGTIGIMILLGYFMPIGAGVDNPLLFLLIFLLWIALAKIYGKHNPKVLVKDIEEQYRDKTNSYKTSYEDLRDSLLAPDDNLIYLKDSLKRIFKLKKESEYITIPRFKYEVFYEIDRSDYRQIIKSLGSIGFDIDVHYDSDHPLIVICAENENKFMNKIEEAYKSHLEYALEERNLMTNLDALQKNSALTSQ